MREPAGDVEGASERGFVLVARLSSITLLKFKSRISQPTSAYVPLFGKARVKVETRLRWRKTFRRRIILPLKIR